MGYPLENMANMANMATTIRGTSSYSNPLCDVGGCSHDHGDLSNKNSKIAIENCTFSSLIYL